MLNSYIRIKVDGSDIVVMERVGSREVYKEKWRVDSIEKATKKLDDYEFLVGSCLVLLSIGDNDRLVGREFKALDDYNISENSPIIIHKGDKIRVVGTQECMDTSGRVAYCVSNRTTKELITILEDKLMPLIIK